MKSMIETRTLGARWNCLMRTFKRKDGLPAYLVAMTVRLIEMHRVLKSTAASICTSIQPRVTTYAGDGSDFWGRKLPQRDCWCYSGMPLHLFQKKHYAIFFFTKTDEYTFILKYPPQKRSANKGTVFEEEKR